MSILDRFRRKPAQTPVDRFDPGDLVIRPASHADARVEAVLPGTGGLSPLLTLVPPPDDGSADRRGEDDSFPPVPVAEWALRFDAARPFDREQIASAMTAAWREGVGRPMFHVVLPDGRAAFLSSAGGPKEAVALWPAWSLGEDFETRAMPDAATLMSQAEGLADWLDGHDAGFTRPPVDRAALDAQIDEARRILAVRPERVALVVWSEGEPLDGRSVWDLLHRMGFRWGDMDCFQWADPSDRVDDLIWVEADDGHLGYVLPEEVAAGRQHFGSVSFSFDVCRTPEPVHVLGEMVRAAEFMAARFDCPVSAMVDDVQHATPQPLHDAVERAVAGLAALGRRPADDVVMRLR